MSRSTKNLKPQIVFFDIYLPILSTSSKNSHSPNRQTNIYFSFSLKICYSNTQNWNFSDAFSWVSVCSISWSNVMLCNLSSSRVNNVMLTQVSWGCFFLFSSTLQLLTCWCWIRIRPVRVAEDCKHWWFLRLVWTSCTLQLFMCCCSME